jgi:hypothetical protein
MTHIIPLRSAWEIASAGEFTQHKRRFGRPLRLAPGERVWLVCDHLPSAAEVFVNDALVGRTPTSGAFSADITDILQIRNGVLIQVASNEGIGSVSIEIRSAE